MDGLELIGFDINALEIGDDKDISRIEILKSTCHMSLEVKSPDDIHTVHIYRNDV
jgi:hypothetical protein